MSGINSAMQAGVTGLSANAAALASISEDIANVNTVGYKANDTQFSDLVSEAAGGNFPSGGVQAINTQDVTTQGVLQSASSPTDLAISGNGFFVTSQNAASPSATNSPYFTRAGAFTENSQGYLVNSAGLYLQGWMANSSGSISAEPSNVALLQPINLSQITSAPVPTDSTVINANLNSTTATNAAAGTYAVGQMASGTVTPDYTIQIPVTDSEGGTQTLQVELMKTATPNSWDAEVVANGATTPVASGSLVFNTDGSIDTASSTLLASPVSVTWPASTGLANQNVTLNLAALTQDNGASSVTSVTSNGATTGTLTSVQVNSAGLVTGVFSNGTSRTVAQLALATFPNPDGLTSVSGDAYQVSLASGTYNITTPGEGGAGTISSSNLESSTVDLSAEFTNMITTQRAYSASSKIITTADSMLQDLISIIR